MKYIYNEEEIIVVEKQGENSFGRVLTTILGNKTTGASARVTVEYEVFEGTEYIVELRVDRLMDNNDIAVSNVIKDVCFYIIPLLRLESYVLPYVLSILATNHSSCNYLLYRELKSYYLRYVGILGNVGLEEDMQALKQIEQLLCFNRCKDCNIDDKEYFEDKRTELKTYDDLIGQIKDRWETFNELSNNLSICQNGKM